MVEGKRTENEGERISIADLCGGIANETGVGIEGEEVG